MEKRTVLITGAAGGIGSAIAQRLAQEGYAIALNYCHSKEAAEHLRDELKKTYGISCEAFQADVSREDETDAMIQTIEETLGPVDILINNAAIDLPNLFSLKTADEFRRVLDVNVVGAYNCAKRVSRGMIEREYGRIVNIASTNGINTYYPMCFDYDASKAALISLTHNLAVQLSPYVTVNAVAPGFIGTEKELEGYDEEFLKSETEKILLKRYGKPEEVASLVKFLIGEEGSYINNSVIRIDGGQMGSV
jgi:3-oxoacyl-[acyl-carrier protein] reductase